MARRIQTGILTIATALAAVGTASAQVMAPALGSVGGRSMFEVLGVS